MVELTGQKVTSPFSQVSSKIVYETFLAAPCAS
jgi:hypothetical protein